MKAVSFSYATIYGLTTKSIILPAKIRCFSQFQNCFAVLIDKNDKLSIDENNRNVYGYNYTGDIIWQIFPPHLLPYGENSSYMEMFPDRETGKLFVFNSNSCRYLVEPETGEMLSREFVK